jgi:hypothetical protein
VSALKQPGWFGKHLALPYPEALIQLKEALQAEGFTIMDQIKLEHLSKAGNKGGLPPSIILTVYNLPSPLLESIPERDFDTNLLISCYVVVRSYNSPEDSDVQFLDPVGVQSIAEDTPGAIELALRVSAALQKVLEILPGSNIYHTSA